MTAISSAVHLLAGMVFLGIVIQESQASGGFGITIPGNFHLKHLAQRRCLALTWNGISANHSCISKIKITVLKNHKSPGLISVSTETQLFHPFQIPKITHTRKNYKGEITYSYITPAFQAVCYYDYHSENSSCCDQIISGLKATPHGLVFKMGNWDWIRFQITRYHVDHINGSHVSIETELFLLPWQDYCILYKPCRDEGTCNNELKPRHFNCYCISGWKGDNCSIPEHFDYAANKCLKDVKAVKKLVDTTVKQCHRMQGYGNI